MSKNIVIGIGFLLSPTLAPLTVLPHSLGAYLESKQLLLLLLAPRDGRTTHLHSTRLRHAGGRRGLRCIMYAVYTSAPGRTDAEHVQHFLGLGSNKWRCAPRKEKVLREAVTACAEWMEESGEEDQHEWSAREAAEVDADQRERGRVGVSGMVSIISIASCSCRRGENADVEADQRERKRAEPGVMGAQVEVDQHEQRAGEKVCGGGGESTEVEADQRERRVEEGVSGGAATKGDSDTSSNASSHSSSSAHTSSASTSISLSSTSSHTPRSSPSSLSSTSDGTPAGGSLNANWGGRESRVARLVLELEVEAVNTSQHEDRGKRQEECTHQTTTTTTTSGVCGGRREDAVEEGVRGTAAGRKDETEEEVEKSCLQAGAGMGIMVGLHRVVGVDVDAAEVEDRMGRAGTGGEGKEAGSGGARVMKPLVCEA
ncbi:hypothetical protein B0H14DRAFT_3695010 [Mycena olivaceomarginata]|nr:hypothetical protein B0H14DRAFT_3695010 [Mycena olivaceomarginata]